MRAVLGGRKVGGGVSGPLSRLGHVQDTFTKCADMSTYMYEQVHRQVCRSGQVDRHAYTVDMCTGMYTGELTRQATLTHIAMRTDMCASVIKCRSTFCRRVYALLQVRV